EIDDPRSTNTTASRSPAFQYRKIDFYDLGVKADQSTKIILSTYTEGGATSSAVWMEASASRETSNIKDLSVFPAGF
ncbi:MAG: hypothetical protein V4808_14815, partial [Pseudomonadota bacterium]